MFKTLIAINRPIKSPCVCSVTQSCPTVCDPWTVARRLLSPWSFPGKNTGVDCYFSLQGIFPTLGSNPSLLCLLHWQGDSLPLCYLGSPKRVHESESEACSDSLWPHELYSPWNFPGQNTGVGSHSLLQRIFPIQGSNPGLPHCRRILYQLSHKGNPRILEWVAYPFSSGSSWLRNRTGVFCIAGRFLTDGDMREILKEYIVHWKA